MPKSTVAGHPLHPMLIVAPAALLPFGFILDAMHRATDNDDYANVRVRVRGAIPVENAPDMKVLPGDERVEHAMEKVERYAPSSGPTLH